MIILFSTRLNNLVAIVIGIIISQSVVLSPEEVKVIFDATENIKHKTIYSVGLRVSECCNLNIVQGIAEFLPISSSAHLIAIPQILRWEDPGLAFDVALHLGTLVAVITFFWRDWINLIHSGIKNPKSKNGKLFWFIVIASIPGAIIGKLFEKQAETAFRNLGLIGTMLILIGIILYIANRKYDSNVKMEDIGFKRSFL